MGGLEGRRAIVTGAASGIGRAIAEDLAAQGARVLVTDINADDGERIASTIKGMFERADMSSRRECDAVVARALREWEGIDILVNNAGLQHVAPVEEFPVDRWEHIVKTMLFGAFYLTRAAIPHMYASGWGRIVNIASVHGLVASPYKSAYVSAKHGVVGLTKSLAVDWGQFNIRVNSVCPGLTYTELAKFVASYIDHALTNSRAIREIKFMDCAMYGINIDRRDDVEASLFKT